jgi:uncharacterized protein DUF6515
MKTQNYTCLALLMLMIFSSTSFGQKFYRANPRVMYGYARPHISFQVAPYAAYPAYPSHGGCHGHGHQPYKVIVPAPGPKVIIPAPPPVPSPGPKVPIPVPTPSPNPKMGMQLNVLPNGYYTFNVGPNPYYYYNGTYYQPYRTGYMVISPPMGAIVYKLPSDARPTEIDGEKYYEYNGTYYREGMDSGNRFSYKVVGTDGVVSNESDASESATTKVGYKTDELPEHCHPVVIDGERLYATASGQYFKKVFEGDKVYYELVDR